MYLLKFSQFEGLGAVHILVHNVDGCQVNTPSISPGQTMLRMDC